MAQESMDFSLFSSEEIGNYDMKIGLNFKDEESGIKATLGWLLGSMQKMVELRNLLICLLSTTLTFISTS